MITETEYYPDGTVKTTSFKDTSDYSQLLLQQSSALLQQSPIGGAENPGYAPQNYMDPALYQSYLQSLYGPNVGYQIPMQMPGYMAPPGMDQGGMGQGNGYEAHRE